MSEPLPVVTLVAQLKTYQTRHQARRELRRLGEVAAPALMELIRDPAVTQNARWAGISLLGECKYAPAAPVLLEIARGGLPLRHDACQALQAITGRHIGDDLAAWDRALGPDGPAAATTPEAPEFQMLRGALQDTARDISWEDPGYIHLRVMLEAGRSQQLVITFEDDPCTLARLLCLYTECGTAETFPESLISRRNVTLRHGKFHAEKDAAGKCCISLRHRLAMDRVDLAALREIVVSMAHEADSLEFELTGADRI